MRAALMIVLTMLALDGGCNRQPTNRKPKPRLPISGVYYGTFDPASIDIERQVEFSTEGKATVTERGRAFGTTPFENTYAGTYDVDGDEITVNLPKHKDTPLKFRFEDRGLVDSSGVEYRRY